MAGIDLASRWLGASVIAASDEAFGEKENLLTPGPPVFRPGRYSHRGEIVDGWETRRRREPGDDWAIIRLGAPGIIASVDVDTSHFTGNYPESASVEACGREGYPSPAELAGSDTAWHQLVPCSPLAGDSRNVFAVSSPYRFTHVRLRVYPDGGVARFRVHGRVVPDPRGLEELTIDLAAQEFGGVVVASSDDFYTSAGQLNRPDDARTMGEGWETRRRRGDGHDFAVIRLGMPGAISRVIIDTRHFKYNASAAAALWATALDPHPAAGDPGWAPLLGRTRLQPDTRHLLDAVTAEPVRYSRLDAFPDGGLSRVRLIGRVTGDGRRAAGYDWFNSLPADQAEECLRAAGLRAVAAARVAALRPLPEGPVRELTGLPGPREVAGLLAAMLEGRRR